MQQLSLASVLQPNIVADTASTTKLMNEAFQRVLIPTGVVQQGERIIDKGDVVTLQQATVLDTYKAMMADRAPKRKSNQWFILLGKVIYVIIALICLYSYLFYFRRDYYDDWKVMSFLMLMVTGFALLCYALQGAIVDGIYLVPMVIVPLLVLIFLDSRTAIYCNFITIMLATLVASIPLEFIVMQLAAGFLGVATTHELTRRSQLIRTAVLTFLIYALVVISVSLMDTGALERATLRTLLFLGINAVFISFGYVFMFIIEKVFGFTSRVTLVELSDINNPLLRRLSEECPGTFQHSMAVSNLASAAAASIGANVQLVRTGALYHDIGKIKNPAFFTENQSGINPHDALDPVQSARIITGHIRQGLSMAEKAKLPKSIRDFISQHHGRGVARYFYNTFCNQHPGQEVDAEPFTYPGPNPQSREASVVMMADSVEAASRSLTDHSPEAIRALVDRIIDAQIKDGLHNESDLSFRDVEKIKETFVRRLANIYHSRIAYPELNKNVPKS